MGTGYSVCIVHTEVKIIDLIIDLGHFKVPQVAVISLISAVKYLP